MQLPVKLLKEGTDTSQGKCKNYVTWHIPIKWLDLQIVLQDFLMTDNIINSIQQWDMNNIR